MSQAAAGSNPPPPQAEQPPVEEPKKDAHGCVIGKEKWNEETKQCVPVTTEPQGTNPPPPTGTEKSLVDRIANVVKDYLKIELEDLRKEVRAEVEAVKTELRGRINAEVEEGVRKGLGVPKDPYVKASELPALIRKSIEASATKDSKGVLQKDTASSPDGTATTDKSPITKMFKEAKL